MNAPLSPTRRDELVELLTLRLRAWRLSTPAILLLQMHAPLAFLGGQMLFATQPFITWLTGERLVRDLAYFLEEPENVERLIARLEG
jgi:uncharacterized membrane protein YjdF